MDKLKLEHLAPYLPYGLKAEMLDYKSDYVGKQYDEIVGFHQWDKNCLYWSTLTIGGSKPNIERIKPILRPLSDLTKEIEHKGKKFIPLHIINGFGKNSESICDRWIEPNLTTQGGGSWEGGIEDDIDTFQFYWLHVKLLSWHFDVFGLIEKGLAIDMNQIDNLLLSSN
ncbi:hypothetical protein D3C87_485960 [compost metagenome]|jgi:hypothetical protein|nr:hypothetical protein [Sphingobacterium sp.]